MKNSFVTGAIVVALMYMATAPNALALPNPGMNIDLSHTALVITDPQNDFLSPKGVTWGGRR